MPFREFQLNLRELPSATPLCATCARWISYPCVIGRTPSEGWRCLHAVQGAPNRNECPVYLREPGSEAW